MTQLLAAIGYQDWILHVLLALPLLGAVPVLLAPAPRARAIALVVTTLEFVLSLGLWWAVDTRTGLLQLSTSIPWMP